MTATVTGSTIRALREKKGYTQKQLGERVGVSDKTVSKWELCRGLPDISLLEPLAAALGVSVEELISGERTVNQNRAGNMRRMKFYLCPVCGNVVWSAGEGVFSCCGSRLVPLETAEAEGEHALSVEIMDGEYYVRSDHPMEKEHHFTFFACVTESRVDFLKLYPEQASEIYLPRQRRGDLYLCCSEHGLFRKKL